LADGFRILGVDFGRLAEEFELRHSVQAYIGWILLSVVTISIGLAEGYFLGADIGVARTLSIAIVACYLVMIPVSALAIFGFIYLGVKWNNRFLVYSTLAILVVGVSLTVLPLAYEIIFITTSEQNTTFEYAIILIGALVDGISGIVFGWALLKCKKGGLISTAGYLNVFNGLLYLSVVLTPLGVLLSIPVLGIEAYALMREDKGKRPAIPQSPKVTPPEDTVKVL
jgi:hypothetical protein